MKDKLFEQSFALWLEQEGEGCDYSIGCGNTLRPLKSTTEKEALEESKEIIYEYGPTMEKAFLVLVYTDLTSYCDIAWKKKEEQRLLEERKEKLAQIKRLQKELGI